MLSLSFSSATYAYLNIRLSWADMGLKVCVCLANNQARIVSNNRDWSFPLSVECLVKTACESRNGLAGRRQMCKDGPCIKREDFNKIEMGRNVNHESSG